MIPFPSIRHQQNPPNYGSPEYLASRFVNEYAGSKRSPPSYGSPEYEESSLIYDLTILKASHPNLPFVERTVHINRQDLAIVSLLRETMNRSTQGFDETRNTPSPMNSPTVREEPLTTDLDKVRDVSLDQPARLAVSDVLFEVIEGFNRISFYETCVVAFIKTFYCVCLKRGDEIVYASSIKGVSSDQRTFIEWKELISIVLEAKRRGEIDRISEIRASNTARKLLIELKSK